MRGIRTLFKFYFEVGMAYEVLIGSCKINMSLSVGALDGRCRVYSFETESEADAAIEEHRKMIEDLEREAKRRPDLYYPDCGKFALVKKLY